MRIIGQTDKGIKRQNNQDAFVVSQKPEQCWAVVCDGVGGANAGEVASKIACDIIGSVFSRSVVPKATQMTLENIITSACSTANADIYAQQRENPLYSGMGTTVVGAIVQNGLATIFWAGDSRAYLLRNDILTQLTTDHTVVQRLVDIGKLAPQDVHKHPDKNHITRALGGEQTMRADFYIHSMEKGDSLLLCSDGVYNYIDPAQLEAIVAVCEAKGDISPIIDGANFGGGGDNITAVIITAPLAEEVCEPWM